MNNFQDHPFLYFGLAVHFLNFVLNTYLLQTNWYIRDYILYRCLYKQRPPLEILQYTPKGQTTPPPTKTNTKAYTSTPHSCHKQTPRHTTPLPLLLQTNTKAHNSIPPLLLLTNTQAHNSTPYLKLQPLKF